MKSEYLKLKIKLYAKHIKKGSLCFSTNYTTKLY